MDFRAAIANPNFTIASCAQGRGLPAGFPNFASSKSADSLVIGESQVRATDIAGDLRRGFAGVELGDAEPVATGAGLTE